MNRLYYGDCLTVMREMPSESVDLIYLDPPFNSNRDYNAIYKDHTGRPLPDQMEAFRDTWTLDEERERAILRIPVLMREAGMDYETAEFWRLWMNALRKTNPRLLAYLSYMVQRLLPMLGILKPTGSLYLHCDPTASHYIKVMLDAVSGHKRFQNEFIWYYSGGGASKKRWARKHDVILLYTKGNTWTFNADAVRVPHKWKSGQLRADGSERDHEKGKLADDVWQHHYVMPWAKERLGYSTQKPLALLERLITASSNPGDMVLDPFCGCATAIEAAHSLGRRWIGIDNSIHAIKRVAKIRLEERLKLVESEDFAIEGIPRNVEGARDLWERDKYHFQKWAVEQADGFVTTRRSGDGAIDGRLYFAEPGRRDLHSMVLEVKGGANVGDDVARDLRGVLERDDASMAGLIVMDDPGTRERANFAQEMAAVGDLDILGVPYPRMQLLTVSEILDGRRFNTPGVVGQSSGQGSLPLSSDAAK